MTAPLSQALREATASAHTSAERSAFVTELVEGRACAAAFTALATQHLLVYRALEDVLRTHYADHPLLAPLDDRRLDRVPSLVHDLEVLVGPDHEVRLADGRLPICVATSAYATTLRERHTPEMVLANHYVRYLGDLSGGQVVARLVHRHYGVPLEGLTFYTFAGIERPKVYKDRYRDRLDRLRLTDAQREAVLAAAVESFRLNEAVFADLSAARTPLHCAAGVGG
ncbi:Heme oxygenase [Serinicoccus hydrothermalis]|uniref:Heme oxygenase n=1 Tax=Serinicoccus hydrothermalis TaxID=1758689 RepID=A0A1B1NEB5_9MICO|nr:biliverdin-producing heme oxygenase [Serinicoccus hydrothermalis]ANS79695.1 Heme oxygenase [Serinicoccus hydrothermalis]